MSFETDVAVSICQVGPAAQKRAVTQSQPQLARGRGGSPPSAQVQRRPAPSQTQGFEEGCGR